MNRRIAVTGASGFIGRHAVAALVERDADVVAVARTPTETINRVTWLNADLLDPAFDARVLVREGCDTLLHLAWMTEHGAFWNAPENIDWAVASTRLATQFFEAGGRRIVAAGTCAEYDPPLKGPCDPERTRIAPATLYGKEKARFHTALVECARAFGREVAWGRVFVPIGPGEDRRRLVPSVAGALLKGETARCTSGVQIRDFIDVRDCGRALAALALTSATGAFDIASGHPVSVRELVERLASLVDCPNEVAYGSLPDRGNEPPNLWGNPASLTAAAGFRPRYSLDETLADAIADAKKSLGS